MKRQNRFAPWDRLDEKQKKIVGMLVIPVIVLILILLIVVVDRPKKAETDATAATTEGTTEDAMKESMRQETDDVESSEAEMKAEETAPADAFAGENFEKDSVPEILDLMKQYLEARAGADAETVNALYGIEGVTGTALEEQKARMRNNSKYVTGFESVTTYVKPGTVEDSWLVYAVAEMKFRSVETTAPMLMWAYVTRDGEGNYRLMDNRTLSAEVLKYVEASNRTEEVRRLAADVNERLKEVLTSDENLNSVYGILNADSPIWMEENESTAAEVVILGDDSTGAETSAASAESTTAPESTAAPETTVAPETTALPETTAESQSPS